MVSSCCSIEQKTKQTHTVGDANAIDHNCSDTISLHRLYSLETSAKHKKLHNLIMLKPLLARFIYIGQYRSKRAVYHLVPRSVATIRRTIYVSYSTGQTLQKDICFQTAPNFDPLSDFSIPYKCWLHALWLRGSQLLKMKLQTRGNAKRQ